MAPTIRRERVTWMRWDPVTRRDRVSHPTVWIYTDPDGYERSFDTRREAGAFAADYEREAA